RGGKEWHIRLFVTRHAHKAKRKPPRFKASAQGLKHAGEHTRVHASECSKVNPVEHPRQSQLDVSSAGSSASIINMRWETSGLASFLFSKYSCAKFSAVIMAMRSKPTIPASSTLCNFSSRKCAALIRLSRSPAGQATRYSLPSKCTITERESLMSSSCLLQTANNRLYALSGSLILKNKLIAFSQ